MVNEVFLMVIGTLFQSPIGEDNKQLLKMWKILASNEWNWPSDPCFSYFFFRIWRVLFWYAINRNFLYAHKGNQKLVEDS